MKVRTRFAPSPTGMLHIGGIRTALYCYALAKKHGGQYIVRVEDTDQNRYIEAGVTEIFKALETYDISPNESDMHGGDFGPYTQSKRLDLYHKYAKELVARGAAYYCFLTDAEVEATKLALKADKRPFRSPHRDLTLEEVQQKINAGEKYVIRQKIEDGRTIEFVDGVQGKLTFHTSDVDEGVLLKSDGSFPTYHLAMLVDDHLMEITHVLRAFEWMPSIPKHVLLYEAMEWEMPEMYHLSTILDPEGGKLSKRKGHTAAMEFIAEGYLPEAVLNFLMLLGWSSPLSREFGEAEREIFSLEEFTDIFDLKDLNKNNPVFNREKLLWFNQQYINKSETADLAEKLKKWLSTYRAEDEAAKLIISDDNLEQKLILVKERAKLLSEIPESLKFFYAKPENVDWNIKQLEKVADKISNLRSEVAELMKSLPEDVSTWQHETWEQGMRAIGDKHEVKHGDVFMVLRVAVVGTPFSPPMFESLQVLGKDRVLERLT